MTSVFSNIARIVTGIYFSFLLPISSASAAAVVKCGEGQLCNPLRFGSLQDFFNAILGIVVQIATPFAILVIIYAGFLFVTAQGNTEQITKAKHVLLWAVVGIAVLLGAALLSQILGNTIRQVILG